MFIIWNHGEQIIIRIIKYINTIRDKIKSTCKASTQSINFLDTTEKIDRCFDPLWKFTIILTGMSEKGFDFIHYHLSLKEIPWDKFGLFVLCFPNFDLGKDFCPCAGGQTWYLIIIVIRLLHTCWVF